MPETLSIQEKIYHSVEGDGPRLDSQGVFGCISYTWPQNHDRRRGQNLKIKPFDDVEEIWHALRGTQEFTKEDLRQWIRMMIRQEDLILQYTHSCPHGKNSRCKVRRRQRILDFVLWFRTKRKELASVLSDPYKILPRTATATEPASASAGQILEVLRPLDGVKRKYLFRALYCVSMAQRPLTATELFAATSTDVEKSAHDENSPLLPENAEELINLCSGLLTTEKTGFVHFTSSALREYLINSKAGEFRSGHTLMAKICLKHLSNTPVSVLRPWDDFSTALCDDCEHPFLRYVACFWDLHYKLAEPESQELPRDLFQLIGLAYQSVYDVETSVVHFNNGDQALGRSIDVGFELCTFSDFKILAATYSQMGAKRIPKRTEVLRSADSTKSWAHFNIQLIEPCSLNRKFLCKAPLWRFSNLHQKMLELQYVQRCNSSGDVTDLTSCSEEPQRGMPRNSSDDRNIPSPERPHTGDKHGSQDEMEMSWEVSDKVSKHVRHLHFPACASHDLLHCGSWTSKLKDPELGLNTTILPTEELASR